MPQPDLTQAKFPLTLAIDIGSSSVRAIMYDANARQIDSSEHRERYRLEITPDGGSMCDPLRIRRLVAKCVRKSCEKIGDNVSAIAHVGISCHWHSLMGINRAGDPVTPVYMWSDKRSSDDARALTDELDEHALHQRTGCRLHSSYWPAKIRWLDRTRRDVTPHVATWCGLSDWLFHPEGQHLTTGVSMASATGMLETSTLQWDEQLLSHLNLDASQLPEIIDNQTGIPSHRVHPDIVAPGLEAMWHQSIGDGAAANVGAGAVGNDRIALTIGTSGAIRLVRPISLTQELPPSLFRYLLNAGTEVIGGALSNGGNMMTWLSGITTNKDQVALMNSSSQFEPDSHGLTILPFFAGERAPSWQDRVGGTITGMSLDTSADHLHRAMLEATALRFATVYESVAQFAASDHDVIASGGALLQSPLWMQITADALGHDIGALPTRTEASARGAAVNAMESAGSISSLRTDLDIRRRYKSIAANTMIYHRARMRQDALERSLSEWEQDFQ